MQLSPQSIFAGLLVTVPDPVPLFETVSVWNAAVPVNAIASGVIAAPLISRDAPFAPELVGRNVTSIEHAAFGASVAAQFEVRAN